MRVPHDYGETPRDEAGILFATGYEFFPITTTYSDISNPKLYIQVDRNSFKYFPRLRV